MKISVIVTTFNRAKIIPMCLDSLVVQNYEKSDFEIIIVNNNSSDNTEEVIEDYIERYPEINLKYYFVPRPGQVYARQIGILAASNEILTFTDDDGILVKDWLKEIANVFSMSDEVVGVAGKIKIKWDEDPPEWIFDYERQLGKLDYGKDIKFEVGLYMNAGNLSIKRDVLFEVGGFNPEMVGEWLMGDGETGLWKKLFKKKYLIGWAPDAVMYHYQVAKKNATVEDIERRFYNNGICIPYNIYAIDQEGKKALLKNMFYASKQWVRWIIKKNRFGILDNKKSEYYAKFRSAFYFAQIRYTLNILFSREFRNKLLSDDWKINLNNTGKPL
ncbi:MAG TPA: glycosyltransferase family 2 protein [Ignavibacteria bacterium]|nr:glycosyltransferase family 2 protein [Ignavibacteria bacterium]HQY51145.1 glycosyltransferase family 2 protein [Ignavibacteria bacterium]HRA98997.1 glycosyltransferase family 2 protein [Ignavibacteria bacterium]